MRVYRSYEDFERDELLKLDSLSTSVDDLLDEGMVVELELDGSAAGAGRKRKSTVSDDE